MIQNYWKSQKHKTIQKQTKILSRRMFPLKQARRIKCDRQRNGDKYKIHGIYSNVVFSKMTKAELRKIYLARQKNLLPQQRKEKSAQIANFVFQNFDLTPVRILHCFLPIEKFSEIDTNLIFQKIWREFPRIVTLAPRVNFQTREIESQKFTTDTKLLENAWSILEPPGGESVKTKEIDIVLVPLLCFDETGFRVGYGKGYYDKFLKNCRADCLKIGLSYFEPVAEIADTQDFDVKLDFCVTPEKIVNFKRE